jgi:hypothetical protein
MIPATMPVITRPNCFSLLLRMRTPLVRLSCADLAVGYPV